ncbi:uncharacterized protein A4U43_C05F1260 [Asparagus officinalis]|uniref:Uncharacterized protein n=1 Tax=Asparagus officinalis TaxID=4686 RepID=A0A5P1ENH4_ASPOF|nr:uncharacterized protein A4U43_C05F1260 [Asparagus officinalis]
MGRCECGGGEGLGCGNEGVVGEREVGSGGEDGSAEGWMEGAGAGAGGFGGSRDGGGGDEEEMEENEGGHVALFLNLVRAHVKTQAMGLGWISEEEIGVVRFRDKMLPSEVDPAETGRFCSHEIDVRKLGHNPSDA